MITLTIEHTKSPRIRRAVSIDSAKELGPGGPALPSERGIRWTIRVSPVRANAKVYMHATKVDREVSIMEHHVMRRTICAQFPCGALQERAKRNVLPMILEQVSKDLTQEMFCCRYRPEFKRTHARFSNSLRTRVS